MIITRTPFRVSFAGGGTDLPDFYRREPGAVVSTAINKYMYITVNKRFDDTIRVSYTRTEIAPSLNEVQHPIVREALRMAGIKDGIEIVSIADIPSGTGLGSSSAFTVGLLNALYAYNGEIKTAEELAREACQIEIDILGEPIGKQDQYIAAYGGICHIQFNPDETVFVNPIPYDRDRCKALSQNMLLFYTGSSRAASEILIEQKANTAREDKFKNLCRMRDLALETKTKLLDHATPDELGQILHEGWLLKKELAGNISNRCIDGYYQKALDAGASGGKILGAGGGGFLLLYCPGYTQQVKEALADLKPMEFSLEQEGSKIIYFVK